MVDAIGKKEVSLVFSGFSCPVNHEMGNFVRNNAIEFSKRKVSIIYLVVDAQGLLVAIFALTHNAIQVLNGDLSQNMHKKCSGMHN
jgi:hypothetical protein